MSHPNQRENEGQVTCLGKPVKFLENLNAVNLFKGLPARKAQPFFGILLLLPLNGAAHRGVLKTGRRIGP